MCGIAGFIGFDNRKLLAEQANRHQQHRGPDAQSTWTDDCVAFAHQRLSIIDLSERSNQPLIKGKWLIIFNGEIYNYQFLKNNLKATYITTSDTEVVLEYYIRYKEKCVDFFEGMFAFAIYNTESQETFIARDHFGIKPLFYTIINNNIAFASELKTLTKIPDFNKTININALVSSMNYLWVAGNETMFKECFKVPPAHYLIIKKDKSYILKKYWELQEKTPQTNEKQVVEELQHVLEDSISRHMVADVPVSSFLSGGLDSSLIAVLAKQHNPNLSTYTIGTRNRDKRAEQMPDDEKYARSLAKLHSFDAHFITIEPDIIKLLPKIVETLDEPIGDPAAINTFLMCQQARASGVKVLLSGMGADEIFCGYRRHQATLLAAKYQRTPSFIKSAIKVTSNLLPVKMFGYGVTPIRWGKRFLSFADQSIDESYRGSYSYYNPSSLQAICNMDVNTEISNMQREHHAMFYDKFNGDLINQMGYTDIQMFMLGLNLTYSDRASMAASVELRVPFIDKKIIEYAMSINGDLKFKEGISKYILKKAAEKYLPHSLVYRRKASFSAPIRSWMSKDLLPIVNDLLSMDRIKERGFFDPKAVQKLIQDDRKGIEDNAYQIYHLLTIELWLQAFMDNQIAE